MKMQIGKWGNSLAVRLPREIVERLGLKEGDSIDGALLESALSEAKRLLTEQDRQAALEEIRNFRMPLQKDWKVDREEANWRPAMDKW